jgi:hypothetical protein
VLRLTVIFIERMWAFITNVGNWSRRAAGKGIANISNWSRHAAGRGIVARRIGSTAATIAAIIVIIMFARCNVIKADLVIEKLKGIVHRKI